MAPSQLKQLKANLQAKRSVNAPKNSTQQQRQQPSRNHDPQRHHTKEARSHDPKARADALRRATLLPALQNRHKVGGILDRRIGENDPTIAPEERMLQRYAKQRGRRGDVFNLDDREEEGGMLTHGGRSLFYGQLDDFAEADAVSDQEEDFLKKRSKRRRSEELEDIHVRDEEPERKKTKKEVMDEVIAKSKFHKYERQKTKEEDDDIREKLDEGLGDLLAVLRGTSRPARYSAALEQPKSNGLVMHPDRLAQLNGETVEPSESKPAEPQPDLPSVEKEVDRQAGILSVKQAGDVQSNGMSDHIPSLTPDEKIKQAEKEYDRRIRQLASEQRAQPTERTKTTEEKAKEEATRLKELEAKRLRRMKGEPDDRDSESAIEEDFSVDEEADMDEDGIEELNEAAAFGLQPSATRKEKPMNFEDEDDFIIDEDLVASGSDIDTDLSEEENQLEPGDEDDAEFLRDVLPEGKPSKENLASSNAKLPFTYPCPQSHQELLAVVKDIPLSDLPLVIQRIRALYHPQLNVQNKEKLSHFAASLVDHLSYLGSGKAPLPSVETLIRHIHSLSRSYADATARSFRAHLGEIQGRNNLTTGDLYILTAIGSIYPTSDHFHQVVTPAMTIMARWLGMTKPTTINDLKTGAYVVALCIKYQDRSKRYIPEAIKFTTAVLEHSPETKLTQSHIHNLLSMSSLWQSKSAFFEMFYPSAFKALKRTGDTKAIQHMRIALHQSVLRRRPLELHHHRPLPIKSSIPKFEENFNPNKHYDPDRERTEANKLKKEYKREKKGAVRELRKDAEFLRREKLKEKKERDAEYEKKQRRLIAEIQGEEGHEAKEYEREKKKRKGRR